MTASARRLVITAMLLTGGCMVGPTYHQPVEAPVAVGDVAPALVTATPSEAAWWRGFGDPQLDELIERGLAANLDVAKAVARVDQARALFAGSTLDLLPHVGSEGIYTRGKEKVPGFSQGRVKVEQAQLGLDAAWEIDLFGRVRHGIEAARRDADASRADLHGVQVSVAAEIARNYLELRGAQARKAVVEANVQTQSDTLTLTRIRKKEGYVDPIDVESARANLAATQAQVPPLAAAQFRSVQRLAVLIGERPGTLDAELAAPVAVPARITPLPIGDASDFLRRRPDVEAAERRLAAETARTGVATADLFPRLNVTGFLGFLSGDISSLLKGGSRAWTISPAVTWPALDIGSAAARLRAQKARGAEALAEYRDTVLHAIEDLRVALNDYREQQAQAAVLVDQVDAARRAAGLAHIRYKEGDIDFLRVLDAERIRLQAEDALTAAQTAVNTDVVAVYKALGGGWQAGKLAAK